MISGGKIDGGGMGCKEITLFKTDINGDGVEDEFVKLLCPDESRYTLKLGGKDKWQIFVPVDKNGGYRWMLEYSPEKVKYWIAERGSLFDMQRSIASVGIKGTTFFLGDVVALPQGGIGRISKMTVHFDPSGKVLESVAYYVSGSELSNDNQKVSLTGLKKISSQTDLLKQVDPIIAFCRKHLTKPMAERAQLLAYTDFEYLREPYKGKVFSIEKRIAEIAKEEIAKRVADSYGRELLMQAVAQKLLLSRSIGALVVATPDQE